MFDRTYVTKECGPTHVTVHEHRAPTDESIRLAAEMREKIVRGILSETRLTSNTFNCVWHHISNPYDFKQELICQYEINGNRHSFSIEVCKYQTEDELIEVLRTGLTKSLMSLFDRPLLTSGALSKIRKS